MVKGLFSSTVLAHVHTALGWRANTTEKHSCTHAHMHMYAYTSNDARERENRMKGLTEREKV